MATSVCPPRFTSSEDYVPQWPTITALHFDLERMQDEGCKNCANAKIVFSRNSATECPYLIRTKTRTFFNCPSITRCSLKVKRSVFKLRTQKCQRHFLVVTPLHMVWFTSGEEQNVAILEVSVLAVFRTGDVLVNKCRQSSVPSFQTSKEDVVNNSHIQLVNDCLWH